LQALIFIYSVFSCNAGSFTSELGLLITICGNGISIPSSWKRRNIS